MEELEKKIRSTIIKYNLIEEGDKIVLGISGGPDSMCMLNSLINLNYQKAQLQIAKFDLVVAHINHMIREDAKDDEIYVKKFCEKNSIEFYSKSIDVQEMANTNKIGTEEAGRIARYDFFDGIAKKTKANKIAIAHNKNDKVETILMNILRGTGIEGLKGIDAKREQYIRPLIECERNEIEDYCNKMKLNPRIDKTNFENIYTRNKIRNVVIPYIQKEFNPNIIQTVDRLSDIISEQESYIKKQVDNIYEQICIEEKFLKTNIEPNVQVILDLKLFNKQEKVIKSMIIRYTITRTFGNLLGIEKIHIEDIIKLCNNNIGNKYLTPNKNLKVLVKNSKIYFIKQE